MGRKSVVPASRRAPTAAGSSPSSSGSAGRKSTGRLSSSSSSSSPPPLLSTFGGAIMAGMLGYLVAYFAQNDNTTPVDTYRRLLSALTNTELPPAVPTGSSLAGCNITALLTDAQDVPGMHLLCVQRVPTGLFAVAFMDGRNGSSSAGPLEVSAPAEDFAGLRTQLEERLGLAPEGRRHPNGPRGKATPNTFQPWAMFTPQGRAVESLLDLAAGANDVLLYEGGAFVWPGVREGHVTHVTDVDGLEGVTMRTLSMSPLVFSVEGFLKPEECQHIRERAAPHMRQSGVQLMDHDRGKEATDWRTSSTYFLRSFGDPVLQSIDRRVADLTRQPVTHQEDVQVLRYDNAQRYDAHHDYFDRRLYSDSNTLNLIQNGRRNRMITVLWYLSNVTRGGETYFPLYDKQHVHTHDLKDCDSLQGGLRSPPREGRVIMFYSLLPNGDVDDKSLHGSCAVKEGTKWGANKWVWNTAK